MRNVLTVLIALVLGVLVLSGQAKAALLASYSFEEIVGGQVLDSSGNGNHATLVGSPILEPDAGVYGSALRLVGGMYAVAPDDPSLEIGSSAFTLEVWYYSNTWVSGRNQIAIAKGSPTTNNSGPIVQANKGSSPGGAWAGAGADGGGWLLNIDYTGIVQSNWHYVVLTGDGSTAKVYLDGNTTPIATQSYSGAIADTDHSLYIGAESTLDSNRMFYGYIDEIRIRDIALSAEEIAYNYEHPTPEPTALVLLATGLLGFLGSRRRG